MQPTHQSSKKLGFASRPPLLIILSQKSGMNLEQPRIRIGRLGLAIIIAMAKGLSFRWLYCGREGVSYRT